MIDRKDFVKIRKEFEKADDEREKTIRSSRELIRLSKQMIYAVQRSDFGNAKGLMRALLNNKKRLKPSNEGHYKTAMQEFVEAIAFYYVVKNDKLPTKAFLGVSSDAYLLGLCDLTGELVRKAINYAIKGKNKEALRIKNVVSDIYNELMQFDFRNSELRKKFDGIKYDLKKLEDLALQIKFKR